MPGFLHHLLVRFGLPARRAPAHWRRRGQWSALLLLVVAAHGWLIGPLNAPMGRPPAPSNVIQMVEVRSSPAAEPVVVPLPDPAADPTPAPAEVTPEPAPLPPLPPPPLPPASPDPPAPEPPVEPAALVLAQRDPAPEITPENGAIDWTRRTPAPDSSAGGASAPTPGGPAMPEIPAPGPVAQAQAADPGLPPPIYLTERPPANFNVEYRVDHRGQVGTGRFSVEIRTGGVYEARFNAVVQERVLMDWISRGFFNRAGFAPQRMVERVRGVETRAVNFQRERGLLSSSSSSRVQPLHHGAQDHVSVLLQLMAIAQAEPGGLQRGQRLRLQVGSPRALGSEWLFQVLGPVRLELEGQPVDTVHLLREPDGLFPQRMEVWLAPRAWHLPVSLRFTQQRSEAIDIYWLTGPLPAALVEGSAAAAAAAAAAASAAASAATPPSDTP